jgi:hypothetical protein
MGKAIMGAVVSLDGFIADNRDDVRPPVGSAARRSSTEGAGRPQLPTALSSGAASGAASRL